MQSHQLPDPNDAPKIVCAVKSGDKECLDSSSSGVSKLFLKESNLLIFKNFDSGLFMTPQTQDFLLNYCTSYPLELLTVLTLVCM